MGEYKCESCGGAFTEPESADAEAVAEAAATFRPEELADSARVCDPCWRAMREAMPDFDVRYSEQGL